jgi:hypothetical protein
LGEEGEYLTAKGAKGKRTQRKERQERQGFWTRTSAEWRGCFQFESSHRDAETAGKLSGKRITAKGEKHAKIFKPFLIHQMSL